MSTQTLIRSGGSLAIQAPTNPAAIGSTMPMIVGMFASFGQWAEINGAEGHFIETIAPGAFARTIADDKTSIRILYDHGQDHVVGRKPIAPLELITEDQRGAFYAGRLFDTGYVWDLLPALRAGLLGSSFRFQPTDVFVRSHPGKSTYNPLGLTERTLREVRILEVGPTPFPVYRGTTADARASARPTVTSAELVRRLTELRRAGSDPGIGRWLDSIAPLPRGRAVGGF